MENLEKYLMLDDWWRSEVDDLEERGGPDHRAEERRGEGTRIHTYSHRLTVSVVNTEIARDRERNDVERCESEGERGEREGVRDPDGKG